VPQGKIQGAEIVGRVVTERPGELAMAARALRPGLERAGLPLGLTMSFTNLIEALKCLAASRCECSSSTKSTTRLRSSIGCGLPIAFSCSASVVLGNSESRNGKRGNPNLIECATL